MPRHPNARGSQKRKAKPSAPAKSFHPKHKQGHKHTTQVKSNGGKNKARKPSLSKKQAKSSQSVTMSAKKLATIFKRQRAQATLSKIKARADAALRKFRPRKLERGRVVFIGTKGQRDSGARGYKGYLVKVTKTGKKRIIKQPKTGYKSSTLKHAEFPLGKQYAKQRRAFTLSKRVLTKQGKAVSRGAGKIKPKGPHDFNAKVVSKLSRSLKKALEAQQSQRSFIVRVVATVILPDGATKTYEAQIPIQKPDRIIIKLQGLENFVAQKVYAFIARELAYDGLVTSGSANHIRALKANKGKPESQWVDRHNEAWRGRGAEIVRIESLEWIIEQAK